MKLDRCGVGCWVVFLQVLAAACAQEPLELEREETQPQPLCELTVRPRILSFGVVQTSRTLIGSLSLMNEGTIACGVEAVRTRGLDLAVEVEPLPRVLQPGEELLLVVRIDNLTPDFEGAIEVWLAGAIDHLEIPVYGASAPASVLVVPRRVVFADPPRCGRERRTITIYNTSDEPVHLQAPRVSSGVHRFEVSGEPAVLLAPGEPTTFEVAHAGGGSGVSARAAVEIAWWPEGQSPQLEQVTLDVAKAPDQPHVDAFQTPADAPRTTTFTLEHTPDPATLVVAIDGSAASGWSFDAGANAVVFGADVAPGPGRRVTASYRVECSR